MEPHLSPEQLDAFVSGRLNAALVSSVERHIDGCEDCRVVLSSLARQEDSLGATRLRRPENLVRFQPGTLIAGKFRMERILGEGGMGTVAAVWHEGLNQRVALKFMQPSLAADPQAVARFQREARAAARLHTSNACRVFDLDALDDGTPFLSMEYLEGETLEQRLLKGAPSVAEAVQWALAVLSALDEAHALGIVHRDLKPANLFLVRRADGSELLKVVDFGIAKSAHPEIEHGLSATSAQMLVGSPPYMSPEQLEPGAPLDGRSDVWSLGVVLYRLLAGKLPFEDPTLVELMFAIRSRPHTPLTAFAVDPRLSALVDRCLAKAPAERPDVPTLAKALATLKDGLQATPRERPPTAPLPAPSKRRWLVPSAAALALAVAATVAVVAWPSAPEPSTALEVPVPPEPKVELVRPVVAREPPTSPAAEPEKAPAPPAPKPAPKRAKANKPAAVDDVFGERR